MQMDVWLDVRKCSLCLLKRLSSKRWNSTRQFVHPFPRTDLCAGAAFGSALQNWQREKVTFGGCFSINFRSLYLGLAIIVLLHFL